VLHGLGMLRAFPGGGLALMAGGDAAVLLGATNNDSGIGVAAGFTYVFDAFKVP